MRRSNIFLSLIVVFGMLLAACSSPKGSNGTPGASGYPYPGASTQESTVGVPVTGGTQQPGTTETSATEMPATEMPTMGITSTEMSTEAPTSMASSTQAVTATQAVSTTGTANQTMDPGRLSNELQFQVVDQNNQPLGQVKDMVLDVQNLKVAYVIVDLSQTSSTTQTEVAVPWDMLQVQSSGQSDNQTGTTPTTTLQTSGSQGAFIFQGDSQKLAGAPAFTPDMLPAFGQPSGDWDASIQSYWGGATAATGSATVTPAAPASTSSPGSETAMSNMQGVILASKVIGFSINPNNQPIASVDDVIVDVSTGDLRYVVLSVTGIPGLANTLIPIPPQVLGIDIQNQTFTLNVDPQMLLNAPKFAQGSFPLTTQPNWDADIQSFWQSQLQTTPQ
jgi:sporulation protein YlmC with PRC-barrel domain